MKSRFFERAFRGLIYVLPAVLYFSYYPLISLGADESLNFEISLPLLWLVVFDVVALVLVVQQKAWMKFLKWWQVWLFPAFVTISVLWSSNIIRGILTVGVMWLIGFAVATMVILKEIILEEKFRRIFWRWFFGSALLVCAWCVIQCILDVAGVPREYSLMCVGCTSFSFGFPHPNGFAIEPQFMGNLLLAPSIISGWLILKKHGNRKLGLYFFIFTVTLFLTFSRGAIYAFVVAMLFLTGFLVVRTKKWKVMLLWPVIILAFLFTLNLQGVLAQVSPTNDTYASGVAKALNHLSLGIIDVRAKDDEVDLTETDNAEIEDEKLENNEAMFDGYVEESTEIRKMLTRNALLVWRRDFVTMMFGVGIGGAGRAMYEAGVIDSPKEIVQNEYASLLLEVGLVGVILAILMVVILVKLAIKNVVAQSALLTILVAYGITLMFFSGLANALQIYLLPSVLFIML